MKADSAAAEAWRSLLFAARERFARHDLEPFPLRGALREYDRPKLLADGRAGEVKVEQNTANAVLAGYCVQAIEKSAPFPRFPDALRALVGDSRDATITFNY